MRRIGRNSNSCDRFVASLNVWPHQTFVSFISFLTNPKSVSHNFHAAPLSLSLPLSTPTLFISQATALPVDALLFPTVFLSRPSPSLLVWREPRRRPQQPDFQSLSRRRISSTVVAPASQRKRRRRPLGRKPPPPRGDCHRGWGRDDAADLESLLVIGPSLAFFLELLCC